MQVTVEFPEDIAESLRTGWQDVERSVLEAIATNAYRSGVLTRSEVARLLGFRTTLQVDEFMTKAGAPFPYGIEDYEQDLKTIRRSKIRQERAGEQTEQRSPQ
jgi:predicted HTH domain antitoxin